MITKIKVGDPVPVVLQIVKSESGLYPQAEIRDDAANLLTTLNMTHEAGGLYVTSTYNMPDEEFVKITYIVYTDAGYTTESSSYLRSIDVFVKDESNTVVPDVAGTSAGLHATTDGLVTVVDGVVDTILVDTDELQTNQGNWATATSVTVSDKTGFSLSDVGVDAILDEIVEGTHSLREILRLLGSYAFGKTSGGGTATVTFRDVDDTKDRIVATVTSVGDRTSIVLTED